METPAGYATIGCFSSINSQWTQILSRQLRETTQFKTLSLNDPFFDSLKAGYGSFEDWFKSKANLYVIDDVGA